MCPMLVPLLTLCLAALTLPAHAAGECRYRAEHGTPAQTTRRSLSVGEIDKTPLAALARLRNEGPHDIRVTFDGAAPRQLARAQAEPAAGEFAQAVVLRSVECLAARSARAPAAGAVQLARQWP